LKLVTYFLILSSVAAVAASGYRLVAKYPVTGEGGWDYLTFDPASNRLFVSHGNQVHVLKADTGSEVASIPAKGSHGIALATESGRGYITNGSADNVTEFDLATLRTIAAIPTGKKPDAILYDPATRRIFANNGDSASSTVINAADGKVLGTVDLGGGPESSASDGKGMVFTNLEDKSELVKIDAAAMKVVARWPVGPCEQPSALAIDRSTRRLFAGCRNHLMALIDADSGKVILTRPIGDHVDAAAFDPDTKRIFFSNGDGSINVFHLDSPATISSVETVRTQAGAKTMALDPKTHRLYLSAAEYEPAESGQRRKVKPGSFSVLVFAE
jgi:DNA-binding beta-propeller fold protein YncE